MDQLGQEGFVRVGGTVWNTWEGGGAEEREGETKILKRGQAGSRGGCLKKKGGGGWNPLTNYEEFLRELIFAN